jgi:hypothetical protein
MDYSAKGEINWPLVVGVAIVGAVAAYTLYSVNELLQSIESVTISPVAELENGISSFLHALNPANWFSSNNATTGD